MTDKQKALYELLKLIVENPSLTERITITIKPSKVEQSGSEAKES